MLKEIKLYADKMEAGGIGGLFTGDDEAPEHPIMASA
jgi:hypothetical protein